MHLTTHRARAPVRPCARAPAKPRNRGRPPSRITEVAASAATGFNDIETAVPTSLAHVARPRRHPLAPQQALELVATSNKTDRFD